MAVGVMGIGIYGIVVVVLTLILAFSRRWSKGAIIFLIIVWIPLLGFGALVLTTIGAAQAGGDILGFLLNCLIVASPIIAIILGILLVMKLMTMWRG